MSSELWVGKVKCGTSNAQPIQRAWDLLASSWRRSFMATFLDLPWHIHPIIATSAATTNIITCSISPSSSWRFISVGTSDQIENRFSSSPHHCFWKTEKSSHHMLISTNIRIPRLCSKLIISDINTKHCIPLQCVKTYWMS